MENILDNKDTKRQPKKTPWEKVLNFFGNKEEETKEPETKTEAYKRELEERLEYKKVKNDYRYKSKDFSVFGIGQIAGLQVLEFRKILAKHKGMAVLALLLLLSSILFHTLSFVKILQLHFEQDSRFLNWLIASGLALSLELVFTVVKYRRYELTSKAMFIGLVFALFYSAYYQVFIEGNYTSLKAFVQNNNTFRFALGLTSFIGLYGLISSITPTNIKKRNYKSLSIIERLRLDRHIDRFDFAKGKLVFKDLSMAYSLKESELKKLLIRKGIYSQDFFILPEYTPRGRTGSKKKQGQKQ